MSSKEESKRSSIHNESIDSSQSTQTSTVSVCVRECLDGGEKHLATKFKPHEIAAVLAKIRDERRIIHDIAQAELEMNAHKLRLLDSLSKDLLQTKTRSLSIASVLKRLQGTGIVGGFQDSTFSSLLHQNFSSQKSSPYRQATKQQRVTSYHENLEHIDIAPDTIFLENWHSLKDKPNVHIQFTSATGAANSTTSVQVKNASISSLKGQEPKCMRLEIDFLVTKNTETKTDAPEDTADIVEPTLSTHNLSENEEKNEGEGVVISLRDTNNPSKAQDSKDAYKERSGSPNIQLKRLRRRDIFSDVSTSSSESSDEQQKERKLTQIKDQAAPNVEASMNDYATPDECSKDAQDLETPTRPLQETLKKSHMSPQHKNCRATSQDSILSKQGIGHEKSNGSSHEEITSQSSKSDNHDVEKPTKNQQLLKFLRKRGFTLAEVEHPFPVDALVRPGHSYDDFESRPGEDYFRVHDGLDNILQVFPDLQVEYDAANSGEPSQNRSETPFIEQRSSQHQNDNSPPALEGRDLEEDDVSTLSQNQPPHSSAPFAQLKSQSSNSALCKKAQPFLEISNGSNSKGKSAKSEPSTIRIEERMERIDLLEPLKINDFVDFFLNEGWSLAREQNSECPILLKPRHRCSEQSVLGKDYLLRDNSKSLKGYIVQTDQCTTAFIRFFLRREKSKLKSIFKTPTTSSGVCSFFTDFRARNSTTRPQSLAVRNTAIDELRSIASIAASVFDQDTKNDVSNNRASITGSSTREVSSPMHKVESSPSLKEKKSERGRKNVRPEKEGKKQQLDSEAIESYSIKTFKRDAYSNLEKSSHRKKIRISLNSPIYSQPRTKNLPLCIDFSKPLKVSRREQLLRAHMCGVDKWQNNFDIDGMNLHSEACSSTSAARQLIVCPLCYSWAMDDLAADTKQTQYCPSRHSILPDPVAVFCYGGDLSGAAGMCFPDQDTVVDHLERAHHVDVQQHLPKARRILRKYQLYSQDIHGLVNTYVRQILGQRDSPERSIQKYFESKSRPQLIDHVFNLLQSSKERQLVFPEARYHLQSKSTWSCLLEVFNPLSHTLPLSQASKTISPRGVDLPLEEYSSLVEWSNHGDNQYLLVGRHARKTFSAVYSEDLAYIRYWLHRIKSEGTIKNAQNLTNLVVWYSSRPSVDITPIDCVKQANSNLKVTEEDDWVHYGRRHHFNFGPFRNKNLTFWDVFRKDPLYCATLKRQSDPAVAQAAFCNWLLRVDAHPIKL